MSYPTNFTREDALKAVGAGWSGLLNRLYDRVDAVRAAGLDLQIVQVKEKFGGLRFYFEFPPIDPETGEQFGTTDPKIAKVAKAFAEAVDQAELESYTICEACGEFGEPVVVDPGGWVKTLCPAHRPPDSRPFTVRPLRL